MPICIAGMHRSGTSMVARLLRDCGLYLGPEEELGFDVRNGEPHWENVRFVELNDEILNRLGGSWHNPPKFRAGPFQFHSEQMEPDADRVPMGNFVGFRQLRQPKAVDMAP